MSTVQEIETAIEQLPQEEFWRLAQWFDEQRDKVWSREIDEKPKPGGRLEKLAKEALKEIEAGETQPLDEFLRNA